VQAAREAVTVSRFLTRAAHGPLLLDGATATCVHAMAATPGPVRGCDYLSIAEPERVRRLHGAYLDAGADIVRTNTFRAASREHAQDAARLCSAAARLAREAADEWSRRTPLRPRSWPVRSVRPNTTPPSEDARAAYRAPLRALIDAGVDLVLLETWYTAAQIAPALAAYLDAASDAGRTVPVLLSVSGRFRSTTTRSPRSIPSCSPASASLRGWGPKGSRRGSRRCAGMRASCRAIRAPDSPTRAGATRTRPTTSPDRRSLRRHGSGGYHRRLLRHDARARCGLARAGGQ
jgi:hypothetical protein